MQHIFCFAAMLSQTYTNVKPSGLAIPLWLGNPAPAWRLLTSGAANAFRAKYI